MKIGYARVSTQDQSLEAQVEALKKAGCEKVYQEKISGTKKNRPELKKMMEHLRPGDTVMVYKLDRLGRSTIDLIKIVSNWQENDINFLSISDKITFDESPIGKVLFTLMAAFAQLERDLISERTKIALAHARKKGRVGGRKKGLTESAKIKAAAAAALYKKDQTPVTQLAKQLGISVTTFYSYLRHEGVQLNSTVNSSRIEKRPKS